VIKGLVATVAVLMTVSAATTFAIIEFIKLAPLLVAAGCLWGSVQLIRARRAADEERLMQAWRRPAPQNVVRDEDTGLASDRADCYVNVSAKALPRVQRLPASYHHRRTFTRCRVVGHRSGRRRP
jgi:hypothetical protein